MHLIQLYLPLYDEKGATISHNSFVAVRDLLTQRFGGITTYSRAPAKGFWKDKGKVKLDDIVVFEVITQRLDRKWWRAYRKTLEVRFRQKQILVRAQAMEII
jgi:hypothetical protein